jgi:S-adenosylmethionine:tRNA ribosyltransferase-isomerase
MRIEEFDYGLPPELIASEPLKDRSASRMLYVNRGDGTFADRAFIDLPKILRAGDLVVLNNTRVFPARLNGRTETGANVELLLEEEVSHNFWHALARPAKRLKAGRNIEFNANLSGEVVERGNDGSVTLRFDPAIDLWEQFEAAGKVPLPHYIKRDDTADDRDRYQTVYAKHRGAIAAPTAGLHFNLEIFDELAAAGIESTELTLHVGYGTFEPVRVEDLAEHRVLPERFELSETAADKLNEAKRDGRRIVAVGTTATRALESAIDQNDNFEPQNTRTSLTVIPGYNFRSVDALLTNFHLPKSSLLILVSTFGGHELIMDAYRHAVIERYRFYSYGDCMFIE